MALHYKVSLLGARNPSVWRIIVMSDNATYFDLHQAIQQAFDWWDYHLFRFEPGKPKQRLPRSEDWAIVDTSIEEDWGEEQLIEARTAPLINKGHLATRFWYTYDYGDSWNLEIRLILYNPAEKGSGQCVARKGASPHEDCGGISGFENLKYYCAKDQYGTATAQEIDEIQSYRVWLGLEDNEVWDAEVGRCRKDLVAATRKAWKKEASAYNARLKAIDKQHEID